MGYCDDANRGWQRTDSDDDVGTVPGVRRDRLYALK